MREGTMSNSMVKDILLKAAEDVQSGMWCKGFYFADDTEATEDAVLIGALALDEALASKRCAHGSIALATKLLGGTRDDLWAAGSAAIDAAQMRGHEDLVDFNDNHLPDDPFEAGQELAELFRSTAESL